MAVRVPIPIGSIADVVAVTARATTRKELNDAFREEAASDRYRGILGMAEDPVGLPTAAPHGGARLGGCSRHGSSKAVFLTIFASKN